MSFDLFRFSLWTIPEFLHSRTFQKPYPFDHSRFFTLWTIPELFLNILKFLQSGPFLDFCILDLPKFLQLDHSKYVPNISRYIPNMSHICPTYFRKVTDGVRKISNSGLYCLKFLRFYKLVSKSQNLTKSYIFECYTCTLHVQLVGTTFSRLNI